MGGLTRSEPCLVLVLVFSIDLTYIHTETLQKKSRHQIDAASCITVEGCILDRLGLFRLRLGQIIGSAMQWLRAFPSFSLLHASASNTTFSRANHLLAALSE